MFAAGAHRSRKAARAMPMLLSGIVRRHEALVADEPVHALPGDPVSIGVGREQLIELLRARSAGQADRHAAAVGGVLASTCSAAVAASAAGSATADDVAVVVRGHRSPELSPASAVAFKQIVGFLRSFAAGFVNLQPLAAGLLPGVEERLHRLPAGLDAVGALKQDVVADHAVIDQRLVAGRRFGLEVILVAELHLDAVDLNRSAPAPWC